ncbi:MAG TPA: phosphoribosylglycinamide formyltransferase [Vicinamibacterales bacterium]|nr:phosphoribosylglycinamide formyltransferase [Vicinamibacterales bacterium]
MPADLPRLAVLISGRGSNLQAIIDAIGDGRVRAEIAVVISNVEAAQGLARADAAGIPTRVLPYRGWPTREAYDSALADTLRDQRVDLVCLAGFMRFLSPAFIDAFAHRILNIHPSLLPSFPGLDAQKQALEYGVQVTGVTVHFVNAQLDAGPIVLQAAVPVLPEDTAATLAARILREEHRVYPEAIRRILDGGWHIDGRRFVQRRRD